MKKLILTITLIATIIIGCGETSSGKEEQTNPHTSTTNSSFKYPGIFEKDKLFFISTKKEAPLILFSGYYEPVKSLLIYELDAVPIAKVYTSVHAPLNMIDTLDGVSRASCGQGGLAAISYSSTDEIATYGEFQMTHFGGVGLKLAGEAANCPSQYFHGYIKYSMSETPNSITVKYGDVSIDPNPFYHANEYIHDDEEGLLGSGTVTFPQFPNKNSLIIKTKSLEKTIVNKNKITDRIKISQADISDIDDGEKRTINASYIREWLENGETFILSTKIDNLVFNKDKSIMSGSIQFRLKVKGKPSRYVNASAHYYKGGVRVTYNKEGVESHRNY